MNLKQRQFRIEVSDSSGARYPATLLCDVEYISENEFSKSDCSITLIVEGKEISGTDRDFFEAFCRVREQLQNEGLIPLCYGASRNVFPSGLLRDMALGLRAYRLQLGQQSGRDDAVSIFDSGLDIDPVSVDIQNQFYDQWLRSPKCSRAAEQALGADSP